MTRSPLTPCKHIRLAALVVALVAAGSLSATWAHAQTGVPPAAAQSAAVTLPIQGISWQLPGGQVASRDGGQWRQVTGSMLTSGTNIRGSLRTFRYGDVVPSREKRVPAARSSSLGRERSTGRKVLGGVIGAAGGFFAGGFIGAAIEGKSCHCDDPGLQGFLVGAPIGALGGAVLGVKFF